MTITVTAADGRSLEVRVTGPDDGFPLVYHHGTPGAAVPFGLLERPAAERGLQVISYSRPGYGSSTPRSEGEHRIADDLADVVAILDHLGHVEFVTLGWSGGGPRALACAALLFDRCRAATSAMGVAPVDAQELDFLAGMGPENVDEFTAALAGREELARWLAENAPPLISATAEQLTEAFGGLLPDVDKAAVTGELADHLATSLRSAGRQGTVGWRDDDLMITRPWGFDVGAISVPVSVWHGQHDLMVPFAHGRWLAEHVAGARAHLYPDEGHVSLIMQLDRMLDDLLEQAGVPRSKA